MENIAAVQSRSYFDGDILGYWGWMLLGIVIDFFTLGIAHPWAYCLMLNWKTKHTVINGKRLVFQGTGMGLFGSWIKWWLLTIITLGIYGLWLPVSLEKWKARHTHVAKQGF
jgi:uncharacterized membrane protein YjgN (DUF898 family)